MRTTTTMLPMHKPHETAQQRGMVSFMVTLIMMLVISLIVIGFTQVTIRTRQEALDRQLSSQAFYAAESGVNSVIRAIQAGTLQNQQTCGGGPYAAPNLTPDNSVGVTCLLVDATPKELTTSANQSTAKTLKVNPVDSATGNPTLLSSLTFSWAQPSSVTDANFDISGCAPRGSYSPDNAGCTFALLRVDILHLSAAMEGNPALTATTLANSTVTLYMQPMAANSDPNLTLTPAVISGSQKAYRLGSSCTTTVPRTCTATIDFQGGAFSLPANPTKFYLRISSLYYDSPKVTVGTSAVNTRFAGGQATIDATGKAHGVLRRVKVSYSLKSQDDMTPIPAIAASNSICKMLSVSAGMASGTTQITNDCP